MAVFSWDGDREEDTGQLVLESLLSSNIDSISDLNLGGNRSWFYNPDTNEER